MQQPDIFSIFFLFDGQRKNKHAKTKIDCVGFKNENKQTFFKIIFATYVF